MADTRVRRIEHVQVAGLPAAIADEASLVRAMCEDCAAWRERAHVRPTMVFDTNGHAISLYATDESFRIAIDTADIVHADGQFVVTFSKLLSSRPVPSRTATTDLIHAAARSAVKKGISFFLLGGKEEVNRACAKHLASLYPGLRIAGRHHGYFDSKDEGRIVRLINRSGADVVWVGLGKPREQLFCSSNRHRLKCGWLVTCGGCFEFICGSYTRAPVWMQKAGVEWVHRMATGPRYLKKRYFRTVPHALWLAASSAAGPVAERARGRARQLWSK